MCDAAVAREGREHVCEALRRLCASTSRRRDGGRPAVLRPTAHRRLAALKAVELLAAARRRELDPHARRRVGRRRREEGRARRERRAGVARERLVQVALHFNRK